MLSSVYGGFGGFTQPHAKPLDYEQPPEEKPEEKPTVKQHQPLVVPINQLLEKKAPRALSPDDAWKRP